MMRPQVTTCSPTCSPSLVHRAIGVPRDVVVEFQRMAAGGEIEQLRLPFQPLTACRLLQRHGGQPVGRGWRQEPALARLRYVAEGVVQMTRFPELRRARFAEAVECADANHGLHLVRRRHDSPVEIRQRREIAPATLSDDPFFRAFGESLHASQRHADGLSFDGELGARAVHGRAARSVCRSR